MKERKEALSRILFVFWLGSCVLLLFGAALKLSLLISFVLLGLIQLLAVGVFFLEDRRTLPRLSLGNWLLLISAGLLGTVLFK